MIARYIYTICLIVGIFNFSIAQNSKQYGKKFEYDVIGEQDAHLVLNDNYNNYLYSIINADGIMASHQMIVRKFDQKHDLIEVYKNEFPKMDQNAFYEYLGFAENQTGKIAAFIEVHSGKLNKSEIYKLEFDKSSGKFTNSLLATNSIISSMKSGNIDLEKSSNGKYIAICFRKYREKGLPEKNQVILIDATTMNIVLQKELSFDDEYTSQNFTITNSGKLVLVRDMKGSKKGITYLTIISASGQEDKKFETPIFLNELKAISIGTEEYLISFNSDSKNFRSDFYNSLLLYDLKSGRILANNKITQFSSIKDLEEVSIRNIMLQNNEIYIFAEAKTSIPFQPSKGGFMSSNMLKTIYKFGPSFVYTLSFEGQLKNTRKLNVSQDLEADNYHSFGVADVRGNYYINTGSFNGIYPLNINLPENDKKPPYFLQSSQQGGNGKFLNQLFTFSPDTNVVVTAETFGVNEMALTSFSALNW